jgi:hypothetical protein
MRMARDYPWPLNLAWALHNWRMLVDEPVARSDVGDGCGGAECCVDVAGLQEMLRRAVRELPARDARRLRRRLRCMPHRWPGR